MVRRRAPGESANLELVPLEASAGPLPERLAGCVYDVAARAWIPPAATGGVPSARRICILEGFTHQIERARRQAVCRRCGEQLEKAALRVGYPTRGGPGVTLCWFHTACGRRDPALVGAARGGERALGRRVLGFDALKEEERRDFREGLLRPLEEEEARAEARQFQPPAPAVAPQLAPHAAPKALRAALLPFQAEGLGWMLAREADSSTRGGILADEMGMGKTLQALALILASPPGAATLVVCPAPALLQWHGEVLRFSAAGSLKVVVYHGSGRKGLEASAFCPQEGDGPCRTVVLTTYGTVQADYLRQVKKYKVPCDACGRRFLPRQLQRHRQHCLHTREGGSKQPPHAPRRVECSQAGGTEPADLRALDAQSRSHPDAEGPPLRKRLRCLPAARPAAGAEGIPWPRRLAPDDEGEFDLSHSLLFRTRWGRIVLDEAHRIKGRTNTTAQAIFELRVLDSGSRWCLSGTPLQNRVGELWALVRFLRFHPFAYYFCSKKGCTCTSLRYQPKHGDTSCRVCGHTQLQHQIYFRCNVSNPIKRFGFLGVGKAAMEKLRKEVLEKILLRRTKAERRAEIQLPPLDISLQRHALSPEEQDVYDAAYARSRTQFDAYVANGTLLNNFANIFDHIMKLRQAADHPYLVTMKTLPTFRGPPEQDSPAASEHWNTEDVCSLCQDIVDEHDARMAQCFHVFHRRCLAGYLEEAPKMPSGFVGCPACNGPLDDDDASAESSGPEEEAAAAAPEGPRGAAGPAHGVTEEPEEFRTSTKLEALVGELKRMLATSPTSKALVFTQFVRFLELIHWRLRLEGIGTVKFDGRVPAATRNRIIIDYQEDPSLRVLLMSLMAGAEGLNLQAADHVFIMDPWWNPASELQAIQRAHRIGQSRAVRAVRFVAKGTVEERVIQLQEKKQSVFDCTVGGSNQPLQRLTAEDIGFLFSGGC